MTMVFARAGVRFTEGFDARLRDYHYPYGNPEEMPLHAEPLQQYDRAHAVMLTEEGAIPREDGVAILRVLRDLGRGGAMVEQRLATGQGFYSGEAILIEKLGREVGGRIHTARSSGCFLGVVACWLLRDRLLGAMEETVLLRDLLLREAREHVHTAFPAYSHDYRHSVAITYGQYLLSEACLMERDFERLATAYERCNWSAAGTLAGAGSEIPIRPERVAELLGFKGVFENARDGTRSYDHILEAECALAIFHTTLARMGEDLDLWFSHEFGMVEIADRYCVTSSLLPQKKNPWALEALRGKHAQVLGRLHGTFVAYAAPTDAYPTLWWDLIPIADTALETARLMRGVLSTLRVKPERMAELAGADWAQASDLAAAIVRGTGLAFRTAHQIVGFLVRLCNERGLGSGEVTPGLLDEAAAAVAGRPLGLGAAEIRRALDPMAAVEIRTTTGGTAPPEVERGIEVAAGRLESHQEQVTARQKALVDARTRLEEAVDALLQGE